ncbi:hypothetical protein PVAND_002815 [Polypedilum vanderplanki]|uniref:Protoporphyrinogen oxidase n=1 Tax=Polypedilum vanderplanki TaxID=319348 RepID=A0A9J6BS59_POLVA|nr:hypothetical protein PVAND_002815 [Polypedilum vanderplanki]
MTVSVLGGGIGGLSALYYLTLRQNATKIKLFEASSRFGGWIKSSKDDKTNVVFETGPRSLRPTGIPGLATLQLIENLGIEDLVVPVHRSHVAAKNRMVYAKNQLCMMPNSLKGIFTTIPPFTKPLFYAGIKDLFTGKSKVPLEDESIYDFIARRFGEEIAQYAISPVICGICAGDAKEISVKFLFKEIFEKEQKYGGVIKGIFKSRKEKVQDANAVTANTEFTKRAKIEGWSIYRMQDGVEIIPKKIVEHLQNNENVELNLNSTCERITFKNDEVHILINGNTQISKHLISTLPSFTLGNLLEHQHPILAKELKSIQYVDVAVINLLYNNEDLLKQKGFGVLVAPSENLGVLGVIFDSCIVDSKNNTVLTVMSGGKWFDKHYGKDSSIQNIEKVALENISKILDIHEKPDVCLTHLNRQCIPQYIVGHHARIERIRKYIAENKLSLSLGGAASDGVGVNDVILSSKRIAEQLVL